MHNVSANYTLPTVLNSLQPAPLSGVKRALNARATATTGTGTTSGSTSTSGSSNSSASGVAATFLNLLSTELQNQDPTDPVDSTAMVGQMISLNQLDQLISINQALTGSSGSGTIGLLQPPAASSGLSNSGAANSQATTSPAPAVNQLPFDPTTLMPLGFVNNAAAIGSSIRSSLMSSSNNSNNTSGGK
jgi:flagellar basal-body rod modification protein FlgD